MGMMRLLACVAAMAVPLAGPVTAQQINALSCSGQSPDWTLEVRGDDATFDYLHRAQLQRMLTTVATGAQWPVALTMIGRGDSAILITEPAICDGGTHSARVLTQHGETPLLLVGCCQLVER